MNLPSIGSSFEDRYEIREALGEGGFAVVYRAWDAATSRDVVIKLLRPTEDGYDARISARFHREARVFGELQHPNIITMYDFGQTDDGLLFMVFEYVAGRELSMVIGDRPLPIPVVRHLTRQLLEALKEAHSKGVLHRDIKPPNVLIYEYAGDPYRAKLLDFGIAKDTSPNAESLTKTGGIVGTLRYMAPEQLGGEHLGPESDIYSLGLVVYEMLAGQRAVPALDQRSMMLQKLASEDIEVPLEFGTPALRAVVNRMLHKERSRRFSNASDVIAALRAARDDTSGGEPAARESPRRPVRARPILEERRDPKWGALALGAVVLVGIVVAIWASREPEPRRVVAPMVQRGGEALTQKAVTPSPAEMRPAEPSPDAGATPDVATGERCGGSVPFAGAGPVDLGLHSPVSAYFPKSYDGRTPMPAVAMFHRAFRTGSDFIGSFEASKVAEANGVVLLGFKSDYAPSWKFEDLTAIVDAIELAHEKYCLDRSRLWMIGDQQGAPAVRAISRSIPISAMAVTFDRSGSYEPSIVPTAAMRVYGLTDRNIPVEGGKSCSPFENSVESAEHIEQSWRKVNECRGKGEPWGDYPDADCRQFDCKRGAFVSCARKGGHYWPGSAGPAIPVNCDDGGPDRFPTGQAVMDFFRENGHVVTEEELAGPRPPIESL